MNQEALASCKPKKTERQEGAVGLGVSSCYLIYVPCLTSLARAPALLGQAGSVNVDHHIGVAVFAAVALS